MTSIEVPVTAASLLDRVRQIETVVGAHGANAEKERRLSDAVSKSMLKQGLYRLWKPKAFGGLEVDPMTAFRVFEEISRIDSAAGWNLQLSCSADPFGAWFPDNGAEEIFGQQDAVLAGSFFPPRKAVPVDGGYRLTGQTPFVSGAHQSHWFLGLAHIYDSETPRVADNGMPMTLITACPLSDVVILDTWRTLGMRGTEATMWLSKTYLFQSGVRRCWHPWKGREKLIRGRFINSRCGLPVRPWQALLLVLPAPPLTTY